MTMTPWPIRRKISSSRSVNSEAASCRSGGTPSSNGSGSINVDTNGNVVLNGTLDAEKAKEVLPQVAALPVAVLADEPGGRRGQQRSMPVQPLPVHDQDPARVAGRRRHASYAMKPPHARPLRPVLRPLRRSRREIGAWIQGLEGP